MPHVTHRIARSILRQYPCTHGAGRIVDKTLWSRLTFSESELEVYTSDGFMMIVNPNDLIGRQIYLTGQFDRAVLSILLALSQPGDLLLDIGANIGYISSGFLNLVADSRTVAVEPQQNVFGMLDRNIKLNGGGRGLAIQAAISDCRGTGTMSGPEPNSGAAQLSLVAGNTPKDANSVTICVPEDALNGESPDIIKIDVEGHEAHVITSLVSIIERDRPRGVLFEHDGELRSGSSQIAEIFETNSYKIYGLRKKLMEWRLQPISSDGFHAHDYLACPREVVPPLVGR